MATRQDPWASVPVVERAPRASEPVQPESAANVTLSDGRKLVRRPDGTMYEVASSSYTNETPTQLLNQGYQPDANGVYAKTIGTQEIPWAEVPAVDVASQQAQQQAVLGAGLDTLEGTQFGAYNRGLIEQAPFMQDAAVAIGSVLSGQPQSRIRAVDQMADQYDRENNAVQRNLGGVAGFSAGLALPAGAGGSAIRTGLVAGGYNALYGLGTGDEAIRNRGDNALVAGATGLAGGTALAKGAQFVAPVVQRLSGIASAGTRTSPVAERVADLERLGIDPTLAGAGGPVSQRTAQTLGGNIFTSGPIASAAERTRAQTIAARGNVAAEFGAAEGRDATGRAISNAAESSAQRLRQEGGELYEPINALEANTTPIPLARSAEAVNTALDVFQTPELRDWFTRNSTDLQEFGKILNRQDNTVTFAEARRLRSIVGSMLQDPQVFNSRSQAGLRDLYGALSTDITEGARALGGDEAASALTRADNYYSAARSRADNLLKQFYQTRTGRDVTDAEAYNRLISAAKTQGNRSSSSMVRQFRDSVTPEEWGEVAGGVVRTLGGEGDNFSVAKFASEYEALTPEARRIMFGGPGREDAFEGLNTLARVARQQQQAGRFYNYSESGNTAGNLAGLGAVGGAASAAFTGGGLLPLLGVATLGGSGNLLARALTSPRVARWVAGPVRTAVEDGDRIARTNPAFREWWTLSRDGVVRAVAQNDNVQALPMQAAASEEEAQR